MNLLTYSIKVTRDFKQQDVVFEVKDLADTTYIYDGSLPPGTYYMDIRVKDSDGNIQYSHDEYNNRHISFFSYSMREFTIQ